MRKKILFDILIFLVIVILILIVFFGNNMNIQSKNTIAVIYLEGTIGGISQNSFSSSDVGKILEELEKVHPKGIVLRISSPGGTVYETDRIYNLINQFKKKNNIKVYVSMGEVCASGGYYISMAGSRVFAEPITETGSIGVIMNLVNYEDFLKKLGIRVTTIKSGKFKDIGSPYRELTPEEQEMFQKIIYELYEKFISVVKEGRKNLTEDKIKELAQGQIYLGIDAYKLGLVDELGNLDDAVNALQKDLGLTNFSIKEYRVKKSFLESLLGVSEKFINLYGTPSETIFKYESTSIRGNYGY